MFRRLLPLFFACLLILLPYAEAHAAPVQQQQSATTYQAIVNTTANIRSGPGLEYSVVTQAQAGQTLTVVACNEDCSWLKLDTGNWIAAFLVELVNSTGDASSNSASRQSIDPNDLELNEPSQAALDIVTKILSYTGLPQSFEVYSANIYNAAALMVNGKRVIVYDPQLITDIENVTDHDWPAVSIFAHEIGHHLAGHTLSKVYNKQYELEADYFSGFILQKMGATLDEAQSVISLLRDHPNMTDHPPQAERLAAIEQGWQEAARQGSLATQALQFPNFASEAAQNSDVSYVPLDGPSILSVLRQAQGQQILSPTEEMIFVSRDWSLGLRALATED
jgi:Zn-dependent protease with chaperone function